MKSIAVKTTYKELTFPCLLMHSSKNEWESEYIVLATGPGSGIVVYVAKQKDTSMWVGRHETAFTFDDTVNFGDSRWTVYDGQVILEN